VASATSAGDGVDVIRLLDAPACGAAARRWGACALGRMIGVGPGEMTCERAVVRPPPPLDIACSACLWLKPNHRSAATLPASTDRRNATSVRDGLGAHPSALILDGMLSFICNAF